MFSKLPGGPWRILLLPVSLVYWLGIGIRNWLYNRNILKSARFGLPVICVGNLAAGGTGKSPMVEYLVEMLKGSYRVATLSRGYKRKTRGYSLAHAETNALEIGDEPMQFHLKFPDVPVAVGESRVEAIPQLLHDHPETGVIILDDAFQHRSVRAGLNILLTERNRLYTRDFYLPAGYLRDQKQSAKRAEIIVVTKCDPGMTEEERASVVKELNPAQQQDVFFTSFNYGRITHILHHSEVGIGSNTGVLLVTGIANPEPLKQYMLRLAGSVDMMHYNDHHIYTIDDLKEIRNRLEQMPGSDRVIISTEKDAVRLHKFQQELATLPIYIIPVKHRFLFGGEQDFMDHVKTFIDSTIKANKENYGQEKFEKEKTS